MKKIFALLTILSLVLCFSSFGLTNKKAVATSDDFDCTFSSGSFYGATTITTYTQEEAFSAGVPSGYTGSVVKVTSSATNKGTILNFSALNIPTWAVESISFKVYVPSDSNKSDGYPEIRIPKPNASGQWSLRYPLASYVGQWREIVLDEDTYFAENQGSVNDFAKDGILDKFELALRHTDVTDFYIDSVKVNCVANDEVAPVINYSGETSVTIAQGQNYEFVVSATGSHGENVKVEKVWSDPTRLDTEGNPLEGEHILTFTATDFFGNTATLTINVTVTTPDTVAPQIHLLAEEIVVKTGTIPYLNVKVTDDKDNNVTVTYTWSSGALDVSGKLKKGTHTLTITATDSSNNQTTKTVTFIVSADGDKTTDVVDEEYLSNNPNNGNNGNESSSEQTSESQTESVNTSTSESTSTSTSKNSSTKKGCKGLLATTPTALVLLGAGLVLFFKKSKRND